MVLIVVRLIQFNVDNFSLWCHIISVYGCKVTQFELKSDTKRFAL